MQSVTKVERLVSLMNALLGAPVAISAADLRRRVPGYHENDAAFHRTFERDKEELKEMGVPLLLEPIPGTDPPQMGYRIRLKDYELKDPGLEPDELEALNLAATVVGVGGGVGQRALFKLGGDHVPRAATELPQDPDLIAVFTGLAERRTLRFTYNNIEREVDPHRLEFVRGRWYLNGFDRVRDAVRWFRVSRVSGGVEVVGERGSAVRPTGTPAGLRLDPWVLGDVTPEEKAEVWFDPAIAAPVRAELGETAVIRDDTSGLVVNLRVTNREGFTSWLTSFLDRAEVLGPAELRAHVVSWLEEMADRG